MENYLIIKKRKSIYILHINCWFSILNNDIWAMYFSEVKSEECLILSIPGGIFLSFIDDITLNRQIPVYLD